MPIPPSKIASQKDTSATNLLLNPKKKGLIIIDPGHGGKDFGTYSTKPPKYKEKFVNLTTAYMLKNFLQQLGYTVKMTRSKDSFVSLEDRASFANDQSPLAFISIHYNSAPNKEAEGIEVFYFRSRKELDRSTESKLLGQSILSNIIRNTEAKSRGVKHGDLAVLRLTNMPAVLIEGGFLTNDGEAERLRSVMYLKKLAWGIAQGINDYLE